MRQFRKIKFRFVELNEFRVIASSKSIARPYLQLFPVQTEKFFVKNRFVGTNTFREHNRECLEDKIVNIERISINY